MSSHTPGPWVIARMSYNRIYVTQPQDRPGRTPGYYAEVRWFTSNPGEVEANARLIAAAPELLEVLQAWDEPEACGCETAACQGTCLPARTRDVLAKAKGGKP